MIEEGFATWEAADTEARVDAAYREAAIRVAMNKYECIDDHGYAAWQFKEAARARRQLRRTHGLWADMHDSLSRSCDEAGGLGYAPEERFALDLEAKLWPDATLML